jgi:hypothetical protein
MIFNRSHPASTDFGILHTNMAQITYSNVPMKKGKPMSQPPNFIPMESKYASRGAPESIPSAPAMENNVYNNAISSFGTRDVSHERAAPPKPDPIIETPIAIFHHS